MGRRAQFASQHEWRSPQRLCRGVSRLGARAGRDHVGDGVGRRCDLLKRAGGHRGQAARAICGRRVLVQHEQIVGGSGQGRSFERVARDDPLEPFIREDRIRRHWQRRGGRIDRDEGRLGRVVTELDLIIAALDPRLRINQAADDEGDAREEAGGEDGGQRGGGLTMVVRRPRAEAGILRDVWDVFHMSRLFCDSTNRICLHSNIHLNPTMDTRLHNFWSVER